MNANTPSTVLVLGARGRFGQAAVQAFAAAGWQVLAQVRPGATVPESAAAGVRWFACDLRDTRGLLAQAAGTQVVVHALNPEYTDAAWVRDAPVLMDCAIAAARGLDALLMFPGNVYNFGAGMPPVLREDTPQRPTTRKGEIRVALERKLAEAAQSGLRSVVLRAGNFFGRGPGTALDLLFARRLQAGRMDLPADLETPTAFAYLPDLAQAFVAVAAHRGELQGATVLHFRGHELRGADWQAVLTQQARARGWLAPDRPLKVGRLPWALLRLGAPLLPVWSSLVKLRYLWSTPHELDNRALRTLIGAEPHTPFAKAVEDSLAAAG